MTADSAKPTVTGPEATPVKKARGEVAIDKERCKGCGYCIEFCPQGVLVLSGKFNQKGYHYPTIAHPEKCTGCDMCGMYCPDFAIFGHRVKT